MKLSLSKNQAFTLVELIVVIGVISVLSAATLIYLNPVQYLKQSRDSVRSQDLTTLNNDINFGESQGIVTYPNTTSTLYVSLVDPGSSSCADLGLPALSGGWQYHCVTSTDSLDKTDGTGWLPINLSNIMGSFYLTNLPIDPINTTSSCEYTMFAYQDSQNWELATRFESDKFIASFPASDGGASDILYEKGKNITIMPSFTCTPTSGGGGVINPTVTISPTNSTVQPYSGPSIPADGGSGGTIYFTIRDTSNNPVSGATITCSASPSTGASFNYYGPNSPASGTTDASGNGWCSVSSTAVETKTVSVTAQLGSDTPVTLSQTADVPFIDPAVVANSNLNFPNGTSAPADGVTLINAVLTANNSNNQPVPNVRTFCNISGLNGATLTGVTVIGDGAFTDSNGQVTCGFASTQVGSYSVSITMGNDTMGPQTISFTNFAGVTISPSLSTVYVYDAQRSLPINGATGQVYIHIIDTTGANVPSAEVQVITDRPNYDVITQPNGVTDSGGGAVGNFSSTVVGTSTISVQARLGSGGSWVLLSQTVAISFTNGVDHTTLTYSPSNLQAPADGISVIKFTLTAYDVNNVPVPNAAMDCGANPNNGEIQVFGAGGSTDANGQITCMFASTVPETSQFYFINSSNVTVQSKNMTFVAVSGNVTSTFVINKSQALPDGSDSITGTMTMVDSNGVPQSGVQFECKIGTSANAWTNYPNGNFTDANGQAVCSVQDSVEETFNFSAWTAPSNRDFQVQVGPSRSVTFTNSPTTGVVSSAASSVTVSPTSLQANGSSLATVTVILKDDSGNPISGVVPDVSVSGSGNTVTLSPQATDANGSSTMQFNSNVAETKTITTIASGVTLSDQPTVIFTSVSNPSLSASNSTVTVDKTSAVADGVDAITATITLKDSLNNPISGVQSTCNVTGSNNAVSTPNLTDSNGQAVCVITSTNPESKTISVDAGSNATLLSDSFETNPLTGWTSASVNGSSANWTQTDRTDFGGPQQGTYMMDFNSYYANSGDSARLYASSGFAFPDAYTPINVSFWMYHETSWDTARDSVQVQVSTDGGTTWQNVGSPVYRYDGTTQWTEHTVSLTGISGSTSNVLIGFLGTADYGNDEFIDNVQVVASPVTLNNQPVVGFISTVSVSAINSTVTVDKTSASADGVDAITATITLLDDSSTPISGVQSTCNVTGSNNTVSTPNLTDSNGQTVCVITSTTAEDKTITVTASGTTLNQSQVVTFANAPIITAGPNATTTQTTATITWSTDQLSDSQVNYGTATSSYSNSSSLDSNLVNNHSVTISGLTPYTTYHFQVVSKDSLGLQLLSGDYSFTTNYWGVVINNSYNPEAISVSQSSDGSYAILGKNAYSSLLGSMVSSTVFKLTPGGILDTSFGTGGFTNLNYDPSYIKQLSDGSYVIGGRYSWPMTVDKYPATGIIKINSNGSLDSSFGNGGYSQSLRAGTGYYPDGQVEQTSDGGYIIAVGYADKILSNGSSDQSFGVNGSSTIFCNGDLGILSAQTPRCAGRMPNDVYQLSGGGYIYVGNQNLSSVPGYPSGDRIMIARVLSDGKTLDTSFGINGSSTDLLPSQVGSDDAGSSVQSSDGGYVIAGYDSNYNIFLIKFTSGGQLDTSFGINASTTHMSAGTAKSFVRNTSDGGYLLFAGDGHVYKYNSNGSLDVSFGNNGLDDLGNTQGSLFAHVDDVRQTLDGGYIAVGGDKSYTRMYILKLDNHGNPTNF